jgi:plasmid stabilization system protein ParE
LQLNIPGDLQRLIDRRISSGAYANAEDVYVLTPLAKADIFDIWAYIAEDSETAADRVQQAVYDACAFLAEGRCAATSDPISRARRHPAKPARSASGPSRVIRAVPLFTGQKASYFSCQPSRLRNSVMCAV